MVYVAFAIKDKEILSPAITLSDPYFDFYIQCTKKVKQKLTLFEELVGLILQREEIMALKQPAAGRIYSGFKGISLEG
jgi:hypothetical protein